MENEPKNFRIVNQYIKDLSFENKLAIDQKVSKIAPTPNINLDIKTLSLGNQLHEVSLFCNVDSKVDDRTVYLIELVYCGICKIQDLPKLEIQNILYSKVPSFIYPYARLIISNLTMHSNFPSINLGPIYFEEIMEDDLKAN